MALNFPTSPTDLQLYTDLNSVVWQYNASKGVWDKYPSKVIREFSGAKLILNNNKGLTTNLLAIEFDDSQYDTEEYFNINQFPSRINIKRTGYYRLNFQLATSNQGTGASYQFSVKKNGTLTISTDTAGPNQFLYYDEISLLYAGDYIEILGLDSSAVGELTTDSFFEIERVGFGMGVSTAFNAFSGVNVKLTSDKSLTSTPTSIEWDTTTININADVDGNVYWSVNDKENILIYTTGYYRVKGTLLTSNSGGTNSYELNLRAAGSTLETTTVSANERLDIDKIYYFTSGSVIDIQASNTGAVGAIKEDSFLQIVRQGI
jgi:hypothetical protein